MHILGPNEEKDLQLVIDRMIEPNGLVAEKFSDEEIRQGQTPDFRIFRNAELVAFCEVKSPRDTLREKLFEALTKAVPGEIVSAGGNDPTFNKIFRHLKKAVSQLRKVNVNGEALNVVIFVNHMPAANFMDLHETVLGHRGWEDGFRDHDMSMKAKALRLHVAHLDLIGWINASAPDKVNWAHTENEQRRQRAIETFGISIHS